MRPRSPPNTLHHTTMAVHQDHDRDGDSNWSNPEDIHLTTDIAREGNVMPAEFAERHDIYAMFVPFAARRFDPLDVLNTARKVIRATPGTAQHVTRSRVAKHHDGLDEAAGGAAYQHLPVEFFLLHGAYPCEDISSKSGSQPVSFANPTTFDHTNLYNVTDRDERLYWLDRYAALGVTRLSDITPHFGLTNESSLQSFLSRHDYEWREKREQGIRRMSRTWYLLREWGYSGMDIGRAFGMSSSAVRNHIHRHVPTDEFDVPADPTLP